MEQEKAFGSGLKELQDATPETQGDMTLCRKLFMANFKIIDIRSKYKMFKIEKPKMINKTFRLPLELVQKLQTIAQNKGVSLNNLIIQCCEYALKNLDNK